MGEKGKGEGKEEKKKKRKKGGGYTGGVQCVWVLLKSVLKWQTY